MLYGRLNSSGAVRFTQVFYKGLNSLSCNLGGGFPCPIMLWILCQIFSNTILEKRGKKFRFSLKFPDIE